MRKPVVVRGSFYVCLCRSVLTVRCARVENAGLEKRTTTQWPPDGADIGESRDRCVTVARSGVRVSAIAWRASDKFLRADQPKNLLSSKALFKGPLDALLRNAQFKAEPLSV